MSTTSIEWTDRVWNPVTGCTKVSQGCKHCYAETIAKRFWATQYPKNDDGSVRKFTDVRCHPERLAEPLSWRKPSRVFVNSMSDLFHEDVPENFVAEVFDVMREAEHHIFQVLTKRPKRMMAFLSKIGLLFAKDDHEEKLKHGVNFQTIYPIPNVWLGVSCEDQTTAEERIPLLLLTPAAVRFVSAEPLLGTLDLSVYLCTGLDWVIVGGESGQGARPMQSAWARYLQYQCKRADVPFFMKQMDKKTEIPKDLFVRQFPKGVR